MAWSVRGVFLLLLSSSIRTYGYSETTFDCEPGWKLNFTSCYMANGTELKYIDARSYCQELGATLASVANATENDFLQELLNATEQFENAPARNFWIGLTKSKHNCPKNNIDCLRRDWTWEDGTNYTYPDWHDWSNHAATLEPAPGDWCTVTNQYLWAGRICAHTNGFICEKAPFLVTVPTTMTTTAAPSSPNPIQGVTPSSTFKQSVNPSSLPADEQSNKDAESRSRMYEKLKLAAIVVYSLLGVCLVILAVQASVFYRRRQLPCQRDEDFSATTKEEDASFDHV